MALVSAVRRQRGRGIRGPAKARKPGRARKPGSYPPLISESPARQPQTKLKVGKPDDKFEQEADRVADQVMRIRGKAKQLDVLGIPNTPEADRRVRQHESNHLTDDFRAFVNIILGWERALAKACEQGLEGAGISPELAQKSLFSQVGALMKVNLPGDKPLFNFSNPAEIGAIFVRAFNDLGAARHKPTAPLGNAITIAVDPGSKDVDAAEMDKVFKSYKGSPRLNSAICRRVILGYTVR